MMTLSEYLKARQEPKASFAERLGFSRSFVSELLAKNPENRKHPSIDTAVKIEAATDGLVPVQSWPKFARVMDHVSQATRPDETAFQGRHSQVAKKSAPRMHNSRRDRKLLSGGEA